MQFLLTHVIPAGKYEKVKCAELDEGGTRILLGENICGGVVMLWPIWFQNI